MSIPYLKKLIPPIDFGGDHKLYSYNIVKLSGRQERLFMRKDSDLLYTYWQDGAFFVGFLNDYPEDSTQGVSLAELEDALFEIYEVKQEEKKRLGTIRKTGRIRLPA
jgi:hypothetical protein